MTEIAANVGGYIAASSKIALTKLSLVFFIFYFQFRHLIVSISGNDAFRGNPNCSIAPLPKQWTKYAASS